MIDFDQIEFASLTDVGVRRAHNQDSRAVLLATDAERWKVTGHIFLVADGMGAHAVGELASEQAANLIPHTYCKYASEGPELALRKAFQEANSSIHARAQQNTEFRGMGTTSTALVVLPDQAWIAHVGDSRAYRIRDGRIEQLSFDHSLVWEMARRQKVDPDGLANIPSNVIIRSLGPDPLVQVDIEGPHTLRPGDRFLLCSDGLSGQLSDLEMGALVSVLPPAEGCRFLVSLANLRGGPDNITVLVVHIGGAAAPTSVAAGPPPSVHQASGLRRLRDFLLQPFIALVARPLAALVIGAVLAAEAALLTGLGVVTGAVAFALAAVVLLLGLCGLAFQWIQEKRQRSAPQSGSEPRIYRSSSCTIDVDLLDRMVRAEGLLRQWAREKNWDPDWGANEYHRQLAEAHLNRGDYAAAFREYCRAIAPFTEALQRHRAKEESFQPVWEKG